MTAKMGEVMHLLGLTREKRVLIMEHTITRENILVLISKQNAKMLINLA